MLEIEKKAIKEFFSAVDKLESLNIIRSSRFLGDLGEFIAHKTIGITLNNNKREVGYDGVLNNLKYEVKYLNGLKTNTSLGNPDKYDVLILVVGKNSVIYDKKYSADYLVYEINTSEVSLFPKNKNGHLFGKNQLIQFNPVYQVILDE